MKIILLISISLLCSCAMISTDDHTEAFEKFDKRFPKTENLLEYEERRNR